MTATFNPALVTITRKRFSVTQGEVLVEYDGQRIEQYGDDIKMREGEWAGWPDTFWMGVAEREAIARGLATAPIDPDPASAVFEEGATYTTRSIVDADHVIAIVVLRRTAKTIRVLTSGKEKTLRVAPSYNGAESVKPWGSYSMAPIITAEKRAAG